MPTDALDVWPSIPDTGARTSAIAPSVLRGPRGAAWLAVLTDPYDRIEGLAEDMGRALLDVEEAAGDLLDLVGRAYSYDRAGLPDYLYRRLLAGWIVARPWAARGAPDWETLDAAWRALVGPGATEISVERVGIVAPVPGVAASAVVDFWPTDDFVQRAGRIFGRLVTPGVEWSVTLAPPGALRLDEDPGLDLGLLAWYASSGGVV